jgi:transcriptional regulator with XRE-family HTH domain
MASDLFPKWLESQMKRRELNQSAVATYLRTSPSTVSAWRRGATPDRAAVAKIAELFGADPSAVESLIAGRDPNAMGEEASAYSYREVDPRVIALARTLRDHELSIWLEMGEVLARTQDAPR